MIGKRLSSVTQLTSAMRLVFRGLLARMRAANAAGGRQLRAQSRNANTFVGGSRARSYAKYRRKKRTHPVYKHNLQIKSTRDSIKILKNKNKVKKS